MHSVQQIIVGCLHTWKIKLYIANCKNQILELIKVQIRAPQKLTSPSISQIHSSCHFGSLKPANNNNCRTKSKTCLVSLYFTYLNQPQLYHYQSSTVNLWLQETKHSFKITLVSETKQKILMIQHNNISYSATQSVRYIIEHSLTIQTILKEQITKYDRVRGATFPVVL